MTNSNSISATIEWQSPSNLAIVKYWGKKNTQEPLNSSISFTLKKAVTITKVTATPADRGDFSFMLDGKPHDAFNEKISLFLEKAKQQLPFLHNHHVHINSHNTFPHSSGIASSASSMSALALCLIDLQGMCQGRPPGHPDLKAASNLARLGSGSACRSVYAGWALWGKHPNVPNSSDQYAIELENIHPNFQSLADAILITDPGSKKISSSAGHALMKNHPFGKARIEQANSNTLKLLDILKSGDYAGFFAIAEHEALTLHALMMSSNPGYTLLQPNSLLIIEEIRKARTQKNIPVGFSMDAGPNVHLLYPKNETNIIVPWIEKTIRPLCYNQTILFDEIKQRNQDMENTKNSQFTFRK
jgi:diphosphomevalonate decarboxylase